MNRRPAAGAAALAVALVAAAAAQREPGRRGARPPGPSFEKTLLVERFDRNGDGRLDAGERAAARAWLAANRPRDDRPGPPGPFGPRGRRPVEDEPPVDAAVPTPDTVPHHPGAELYDQTVVRTLFFELPQGWEAELADFHRTDVEIEATLTVDGRVYAGVGVRYRGNTSFMMVPDGKKRPLNVSIDFVDPQQRLYGYRTLNLLNCHGDPSFLREVVFSQVCREYVPAKQANLVRVVINSEDHGVYANVQQFDKVFVEERFGSKRGARFKVPPNFDGDGALVDLGDDLEPYRRAYQIKSKDDEESWRQLVALCHALNRTPDDQLEAVLPAHLDIDEALWFLALDCVFMDGDGYFSRGSDYLLHADADGRFTLIPYDDNETFAFGGGPGGGGPPPFGGRRPPRSGPPGGRPPGPGRGSARAADLSPYAGIDDPRRPLLSRLLSVPAWRARYRAHLRTLVTRWLDWEVLGPVFERQHASIDELVRCDPRRLYRYDDFVQSLGTESLAAGGPGGAPGLRQFVEARRAFLLGHEALAESAPFERGASGTR